jgi:hypothetical protein
MPHAGLGLELAPRSYWTVRLRAGRAARQFASAIRAVTVPPLVDIGVRYPNPPGGGTPNILGLLFDNWVSGDPFPAAPSPDCPKLRGLYDFRRLAPLLLAGGALLASRVASGGGGHRRGGPTRPREGSGR